MKHFWLALMLLTGVPTLVQAQVSTSPDQSVSAPAAPSNSTFTINIDAPDDIKDLLTRHLELQRYRDLTDLSEDEMDRLMSLAEQDARKLLGTLGYFSPTITVQRQPVSVSTQPPKVNVSVLPGEPTRVGQVQILFSGAIATDPQATAQRELILSSWLLPAGSRFTQTAWDAAKQQALRQLTTQRFPAGHISATQADIDTESQQATLQLTLDSGAAYRLGDLVVTGLVLYDTDLVKRLAHLTPGATYDQVELVEAQQRLADSGYFDAAFVAIDTASDPNTAQVLVKLREAHLKKIVLGIGVSTDSGPRLSAEHTHHKVPGIGWRAVSKLQLERDTQSVSSALTSPPDDDNWRWAASGLLQNQLLGSADVTSQRLRGGRTQSSMRIDRNLYLQYDRAATVDTDATQPVIAQSISANYAFAVRYYDNLPFPTGGWGWNAEVGGGTTLGDQPEAYTRLISRLQGFLQLGNTSPTSTDTQASAGRIALRGGIGAIGAKDGIPLPSTQLFLTGGDNSVRGYGLNDIGVILADGTTTAGRYMITASVEWQHPIRVNGRLSDWESTVFIDSGGIANQPSELAPKIGVGAGARWKSPVGPLQIDLAYGVDAKRFRLHMNLGFTF
jgi:translocation and assembly module TamA